MNREFKNALIKSNACIAAKLWSTNMLPSEAWEKCKVPGWLLYAKLACTDIHKHRVYINRFVAECKKHGVIADVWYRNPLLSAEICKALRATWRLPNIKKVRAITIDEAFSTITTLIRIQNER